MRKCILRVTLVYVLTQSCASTSDKKIEDNLVTSYPAAKSWTHSWSSEVPIGRRLLHYDGNTVDDQAENYAKSYGHIRFENDTPGSPAKFENENKEDYSKTDNTGVNFKHISFEGDKNDRRLTAFNQFDGEHSDHKVRFDGPFASPTETGNTGSADESDNDHIKNHNMAALHDDNEKFNDYDSYDYVSDLNDIENEDENIKNVEAGKSNDSKRVTFEDNDKRETQDDYPKKKRKSRRKPRVHALSPGNPSYASNYPGPSYPGPVDPNSGNRRYPPIYPTTYPTSPYSNPNYQRYPPYPGNPDAYPGHSTYPAYQGSQRPQSYPVKYPGQNDHENPDAQQGRPPIPGRPGVYPGQEYAGAGYVGYPPQSGYGYADPSGQNSQYNPHPGYYRPPRRPKSQSLTQRAVSAVAEALTSIALYDDKQCVPRLLCEVASGSTASSPTLLKATAGLGPLITVLQAYNGASSSPLFLFGRAAVLGVTTKGNPTSCRYAYPQCPNDPAGLINYLNNHNGGFFRFFGQPESQNQPQNLEQFYSQLSGQYGLQQQQQPQKKPQNQQQLQHNQGYPYSYGLQYPYTNNPNYKPNYYQGQNSFRNVQDRDSDVALSNIEERIQNKPGTYALEEEYDENNSKWTFPDEEDNNKREQKSKRERKEKARKPRFPESPTRVERGGSTLKFPDDRGPPEDSLLINREREYIKQQKGVYFSNNNHFNFQTSYQTPTPANLDEYVFDYKHNFYVKRPKTITNDDSQTVYIVRGNGDPNHPEIVKVRPGQSALA